VQLSSSREQFREKLLGSRRKDRVVQPSDLPGSCDHAKGRLDLRWRFEAAQTVETLKRFRFDELIIIRLG